MAAMGNLFHEAEEAAEGVWDHTLGTFIRRNQTSAAQAAATATIETNPREEPVSLFTEAKSIGHDLLDKLENLDENAIGATEAIKASPTGVSIVNELAAIAHIPDPQGLLDGILSAMKSVSTALRAAEAATAATAAAVPQGPVVGGQA